MATREDALIRDGVRCVRCGATGALEVDHVTPLFQGGSNDMSNLETLCHECHAKKTAEEQGCKRRPAIGADGWPVGGVSNV